ncbi:hypothetical protein DFH11DRAFT_830041 [Phellopilus nigrolimitatus]|nr:hypothetical protein DFH11DRAFT_830041 [Phellopilus nigrolimitatus]
MSMYDDDAAPRAELRRSSLHRKQSTCTQSGNEHPSFRIALSSGIAYIPYSPASESNRALSEPASRAKPAAPEERKIHSAFSPTAIHDFLIYCEKRMRARASRTTCARWISSDKGTNEGEEESCPELQYKRVRFGARPAGGKGLPSPVVSSSSRPPRSQMYMYPSVHARPRFSYSRTRKSREAAPGAELASGAIQAALVRRARHAPDPAPAPVPISTARLSVCLSVCLSVVIVASRRRHALGAPGARMRGAGSARRNQKTTPKNHSNKTPCSGRSLALQPGPGVADIQDARAWDSQDRIKRDRMGWDGMG